MEAVARVVSRIILTAIDGIDDMLVAEDAAEAASKAVAAVLFKDGYANDMKFPEATLRAANDAAKLVVDEIQAKAKAAASTEVGVYLESLKYQRYQWTFYKAEVYTLEHLSHWRANPDRLHVRPFACMQLPPCV